MTGGGDGGEGRGGEGTYFFTATTESFDDFAV